MRDLDEQLPMQCGLAVSCSLVRPYPFRGRATGEPAVYLELHIGEFAVTAGTPK